MNPFVSVHMIVKENTNLGKLFIEANFMSQYEAAFPNEIVLIDNGSSQFIFDEVYEPWIKKFKDIDCEVKLIKSDADNFRDLRNMCLASCNPNTSYVLWQDSDECSFVEDLDILKNQLMADSSNISMIWTYFYHLMIHPFQVQVDQERIKRNLPIDKPHDFLIKKDNVFKYHKGLKWHSDKRVHEKMINLLPGHDLDSNYQYIHFGYVRPQWITALKWLKYDMIEHGHMNGYKHENIEVDEDGNNILDTGKPKVKTIQKDYFRSWRTPNACISDRQDICKPFPDPKGLTKTELPEGYYHIIGNATDGESWNKRLEELDSQQFWYDWQELYNEKGNWTDTLDEMYERAKQEKLI